MSTLNKKTSYTAQGDFAGKAADLLEQAESGFAHKFQSFVTTAAGILASFAAPAAGDANFCVHELLEYDKELTLQRRAVSFFLLFSYLFILILCEFSPWKLQILLRKCPI